MTTEERTEKMRELGRKGGQVGGVAVWAGTTPGERRKAMREVRAAALPGYNRKAGAERCPCGKMTLSRATARGKSRDHARHCSFHKPTRSPYRRKAE